jgi:hypothetical protein
MKPNHVELLAIAYQLALTKLIVISNGQVLEAEILKEAIALAEKSDSRQIYQITKRAMQRVDWYLPSDTRAFPAQPELDDWPAPVNPTA